MLAGESQTTMLSKPGGWSSWQAKIRAAVLGRMSVVARGFDERLAP
jgi:hypothetical protein